MSHTRGYFNFRRGGFHGARRKEAVFVFISSRLVHITIRCTYIYSGSYFIKHQFINGIADLQMEMGWLIPKVLLVDDLCADNVIGKEVHISLDLLSVIGVENSRPRP